MKKKPLVIYIHINSSLTMQNTDWVVQHSAIFHIVINTIDTPKGSREGCRYDNYYLKTTIIIIIDWSISHSWCYNTKNLTCFFMEGKMLFKMKIQGPTWSTGCPIPIKNSPWKVESAVELKGLSDPTLSWFLLHGVTRSIITTVPLDGMLLHCRVITPSLTFHQAPLSVSCYLCMLLGGVRHIQYRVIFKP